MRCPYCAHIESQVKDSRPNDADGTIRRRRICSECGARFTTLERVQLRDISVRKTGGELQPFDRDKLTYSIRVACRKRNVSEKQIESIVTSIQRRLETENSDDIISSEHIGEMVMESLMALDPIAFVRFVSVQKRFAKISDFKKIIATIPEAEEGRDVCELPKQFTSGKLF